MIAHQAMHLFNTGKRGGDAALQTGGIRPGGCNLYKRAEQRAAAVNLNA